MQSPEFIKYSNMLSEMNAMPVHFLEHCLRQYVNIFMKSDYLVCWEIAFLWEDAI